MTTLPLRLSPPASPARPPVPAAADPGPALRTGAGGAALAVVTGAAVLLAVPPATALALAALVAAVAAWRTSLGLALLLGATAWALVTGFVVNDGATLTLAGPDLLRLVVALAAAVGGLLLPRLLGRSA